MISQMEKEALFAPEAIARQFAGNQQILQALAKRIHSASPRFAVTIARGSSDHAATFAKYLLETQLGLVTSSAAPSVVTLYEAKLQLRDALVIGLSQSGQSPDIAEMLQNARAAGAITVAFVNHSDSPLAHAAEFVVPLCAGDELAVAATKSYITTLSALVHLIACLKEEAALSKALLALPDAMTAAAKMDWSAAIEVYLQQKNTLVIGRGFSYPIAQETALKFKETAVIHAEAFSGAELLHGPFALVQPDFPLLMYAGKDAALPGVLALAQRVKQLGAKTLVVASHDVAVSSEEASIKLPIPNALHPLCDPLMMIQAMYIMMARLAIARGYNPDAPKNLSKVTKTW